MKTTLLVCSLFCCVCFTAVETRSQSVQPSGVPNVPPPSDYTVTQQGPHSQVWQRTTYELSPDGSIIPRIHSYTELQTGLNHVDPVSGQWVASSDQITATATGAEIANCQHQVVFAGNLNAAGAVELTTPDGKRLRSNILGLAYYDTSSGQSVFFAEIQDCAGEILPSGNQALFVNAFAGINSDVLYENKTAGFEQFIVLREQLPSPANWNLNPATTMLQVVTEFLDPPAPAVTLVQSEAGPDHFLDFGVMHMRKGEAFAIGSEDDKVPVTKQWLLWEGRTVLVEQVPLQSIQPHLQSLPSSSSGSASLHLSPDSVLHRVASQRLLPPRKLAHRDTKGLRLAGAAPKSKGFVLDYSILLSQTNATLHGDTTYYVSGLVNIYGTLTLEGGTVIKYTNSPAATIVATNVNWTTADFRPSIFTAKDDNTVGQTVSGSSGSPAGNYGGAALNFSSSSGTGLVSNARFSYCSNAVSGGLQTVFQDVQFNNCRSVVADQNGFFYLRNVLCRQCGGFQNLPCVGCGGINLEAENSTFDRCTNFAANPAASVMYFTNCILTELTNWLAGSGFATNNCAVLTSDSGVFQTVGGGGYYLTNGSPYRGVGTTNINPGLLADLAAKTTCPPLVFSNQNISAATNYSPQACRDTGTNGVLDLGYHYDPLDYVFGGCVLNTNLSFAAGTVMGTFESSGSVSASGQPYGLLLENGANLTASGTVTAPCRIVRFTTAQEGVNGNWTSIGWMGAITLDGSGTTNAAVAPQLNCQFTKFGGVDDSGVVYRDNWNYGIVRATDCEFYTGVIASYCDPHYLTNCLFFRVAEYLYGYSGSPYGLNLTIQNCTFYNGFLVMARWSGQTASFWNIENTAFDGTGFAWTDNYNGNSNYTAFNYNAYNTNNLSWQTYPYPYPPNTNTLEVTGLHDVFFGGYNWESGPLLGNFYQPSNSPTIHVGSAPASSLGLYHFTVMTNLVNGLEIPEGTNIVSIGYHYVATDQYSNPIDTNGDGIPDYLEDANGDGIFDAGDLADWQISPFGLSGANALEVFTPLH
jgi:hypothetical protein